MTEVVKKQLPEHHVPGKRLGRHIEHDPRSRAFGFGAIISPSSMHTVHHRRFGLPFDQGQIGSCTGNAVAGAINTVPLHTPHSHLLKEEDAVGFYKRATVIDGFPGSYPPDDTGSSGLAAAKAAQEKGLITSYKHAFSIEEALSALQVGPVITGTDWFEGFDNPIDGLVKIAGQSRGGHEYELLGFVLRAPFEDSLVIGENSWGLGFGLRGRFHYTVATWRQLLDAQGDVTILVR